MVSVRILYKSVRAVFPPQRVRCGGLIFCQSHSRQVNLKITTIQASTPSSVISFAKCDSPGFGSLGGRQDLGRASRALFDRILSASFPTGVVITLAFVPFQGSGLVAYVRNERSRDSDVMLILKTRCHTNDTTRLSKKGYLVGVPRPTARPRNYPQR